MSSRDISLVNPSPESQVTLYEDNHMQWQSVTHRQNLFLFLQTNTTR